MKKAIHILLAMCLLCTAGLGLAEDAADAPAEENAGGASMLTGTVTGVLPEGGYLLETIEDGTPYQVAVDADTLQVADWAIGEGDVVLVSYDGEAADPSEDAPTQVTATAVRSFTEEGLVQAVDADMNRVELHSPLGVRFWVTLPEGEDAAAYEGKYIRVYHSGVMALSEPAQFGALKVLVVEVARGVITEVADGYFLMDWEESALRVNHDDRTKAVTPFVEGDTVSVFYNGIMARSMPGQIFANVIYTDVPAE